MLEEDEASLPCFAHLHDFEHKAARTVQIYNQNGARHAPYQVAAALKRLPGSGRPAPSRKHKVTRPGRSTGRSTKEKIASEGGRGRTKVDDQPIVVVIDPLDSAGDELSHFGERAAGEGATSRSYFARKESSCCAASARGASAGDFFGGVGSSISQPA
jgi:hypothetical protein